MYLGTKVTFLLTLLSSFVFFFRSLHGITFILSPRAKVSALFVPYSTRHPIHLI